MKENKVDFILIRNSALVKQRNKWHKSCLGKFQKFWTFWKENEMERKVTVGDIDLFS